MKTKRIISGLIGAVMAISATISTISATVSAVEPENDAFVDLSQTEITEAMGAGWNLGNQLEASSNKVPNETAWGNPVITKELIHTVKEAGFKSIRIPVSYLSKIGETPDYTIDSDWLDRINTVVDYAIDEELYVIINMHGDGYNTVDGGWLLCNAPDDQQPAIKEKYKSCWKQISERFADYDEHLIFESMNEEFNGGWSTPDRSQYANINAYNQIFIDTVRQTGGNNAKRWLLICGWNTDIDYTVGNYGFEFPTDTHRDPSIEENRLMMSVHYYAPWDFCGDGTSGRYSQWGSDANPSKVASYSNTRESMEEQIKKVYDKFVKVGYPVIIGEYGCINKTESDPVNNIFRARYCKAMCELSKEYGCVPVYWDNGAVADSFGLINRNTYAIEQPELIDAMMEVYLTPEENVNSFINRASSFNGEWYTDETWEALDTAVTNAQNLISSGTATDEQYQEAYKALHDAYYALMPSESYLREQVVASDETTADSDNIETEDGLFISVAPDKLSVVTSKLITIKFKVLSGTPNDDDNMFVLKPYSNNKFDGWTDNFVKFSDCEPCDDDSSEYSVTVDPQKVLASYVDSPYGHGDPNGANSINIYYCTKGTDTNLQLTYCSFAFTVSHTRHYYAESERFEKTEFEDGYINYKCLACDEIYTETFKATGHSWDSWKTVKEATCTEDGSEERVCRTCSEKETRSISAKGHNYANGVCTVCGAKDPNYIPPTSFKIIETTPPASTTRNSALVEKDRAAAKKAMKQAKITKLTAKSKAKKKITVTWKKVKKAKGYEVQVSAKKNFKKVIFKKLTSSKKLTIKNSKIKSKKTYFVRVRAYATYLDANGKAQKVYSKWNKKLRKVKVK